MVGLLLAGITAAKSKHPVWGVVLCTLAAAIKAPAGLGVLYVGWDWLGSGLTVAPAGPAARHRGPHLRSASWLLLSLVSGLGWGWVGQPGDAGHRPQLAGPGHRHRHAARGHRPRGRAHRRLDAPRVLSVTRVLGLLGAPLAAALYLLINSERIGALRALGLSLLLFVVLGPVVQPWYLTWGLAPAGAGRAGRYLRSLIIAAVGAVALHRPARRADPARPADPRRPAVGGAGPGRPAGRAGRARSGAGRPPGAGTATTSRTSEDSSGRGPQLGRQA